MKQAPILVTGAPRSGTTFLGKMLALPGHVLYVDEPFNMQTGIEGVHKAFPNPGEYSEPGSIDDIYMAIVGRLLHGRARFKSSDLRPAAKNPLHQMARELWVSRENLSYKIQAGSPFKQRYLIKDPMAFSLSEYLHRRFDMKTVIIMRHPLSTIASYKRLNWHYDVIDLLTRSNFIDEHLGKLLQTVEAESLNEIEAWSWMWLAIYSMLKQFMHRNPAMIFITHEELSLHAHKVLEDLYGKLGLPYTGQIHRKIAGYTSGENPTNPTGNLPHVLHRNSAENINRWKQILTEAEVGVIKKITGPFVGEFYPEASWDYASDFKHAS